MTAPRILIIDDEPVISKSLAAYLQDNDFETRTCLSAEEALKMVQQQEFALAIVDLRLPGMSGEKFILTAHTIRPGLRFLIHTGSVDYRPGSEIRAVGIRPEHVFLKPVKDLSVISHAVQKILEEASSCS